MEDVRVCRECKGIMKRVSENPITFVCETCGRKTISSAKEQKVNKVHVKNGLTKTERSRVYNMSETTMMTAEERTHMDDLLSKYKDGWKNREGRTCKALSESLKYRFRLFTDYLLYVGKVTPYDENTIDIDYFVDADHNVRVSYSLDKVRIFAYSSDIPDGYYKNYMDTSMLYRCDITGFKILSSEASCDACDFFDHSQILNACAKVNLLIMKYLGNKYDIMVDGKMDWNRPVEDLYKLINVFVEDDILGTTVIPKVKTAIIWDIVYVVSMMRSLYDDNQYMKKIKSKSEVSHGNKV